MFCGCRASVDPTAMGGAQGTMLGAMQSLYDSCLLSMRVNGRAGDTQTPSMGLRKGCFLSATLFSLFIDGLHHCDDPRDCGT